MKRKFTAILLFSLILTTSCTTNHMTSIYNSNEKISSSTDSFNLDGVTQKIEDEKFFGEVERFEGMDTIWTYEAAEDMELEVTYLLNALKGSVKLVLISPDNSVIDVIERSDESNFNDYVTSTIPIQKGTNRLKMVGSKHCSVEFEITIPCGEFKELGF